MKVHPPPHLSPFNVDNGGFKHVYESQPLYTPFNDENGGFKHVHESPPPFPPLPSNCKCSLNSYLYARFCQPSSARTSLSSFWQTSPSKGEPDCRWSRTKLESETFQLNKISSDRHKIIIIINIRHLTHEHFISQKKSGHTKFNLILSDLKHGDEICTEGRVAGMPFNYCSVWIIFTIPYP